MYSKAGIRATAPESIGLGFAIGANNVFDSDPPPCFTCGLNNMDPTTYDVPGTFFYARATLRM